MVGGTLPEGVLTRAYSSWGIAEIPERNSMAERSKGELAFIEQRTRQLLVEWADRQLREGSLGSIHVTTIQVYVEHALYKGFLTKREPTRLTAKGWSAAASFLKR
jgi:hypothetical protein